MMTQKLSKWKSCIATTIYQPGRIGLKSWKGSLYNAIYHRFVDGTITKFQALCRQVI
jgi:hypothetical protein